MNKKNKHKLLCCLLMVILAVPVLCCGEQEDDFSQLPKEIRTKVYVQEYEDPERAEWQNMEGVIDFIGLKTGQRIADIGGGSGYFTRPFARRVGPKGVVYCCDIDDGLLGYVQQNAKEEGLGNIVTVFAAKDRPMLPPQSVDVIFFCNVHHHLDQPVQYYTDMKPLLKPDGVAIIMIWKKILNEDKTERFLYNEVVDSMKSAGWRLMRENRTLVDRQDILIFHPVQD